MPPATSPSFLLGGGEMGERIRAHDWVASPLGDPADWPQPLTTLDKAKKEASHRWPQALPGGEAVLFTSNSQSVGNFDNASIEVVSLKTGARTVVYNGGAFGRYVPSGHLVYVNKGTIFAVPFDAKTFKVSGTPAPAVQNVSSSPAEGAAQIVESGKS